MRLLLDGNSGNRCCFQGHKALQQRSAFLWRSTFHGSIKILCGPLFLGVHIKVPECCVSKTQHPDLIASNCLAVIGQGDVFLALLGGNNDCILPNVINRSLNQHFLVNSHVYILPFWLQRVPQGGLVSASFTGRPGCTTPVSSYAALAAKYNWPFFVSLPDATSIPINDSNWS